MTKRNNRDDDDSGHDLTRIEDLSEFLHVEDPELEDKFGGFKEESNEETEVTSGISLDELDVLPTTDLPPDLPVDLAFNLDDHSDNQSDDQSDDQSDILEEMSDLPFESETPSTDLDLDNLDFNSEDSSNEDQTFDDSPFELSADEDFKDNQPNQEEDQQDIPIPTVSPEKFEEVRNFAQNFSYGEIQGGGNPPFSIIIRNLKYENDAEDIVIILREFGLVTDQNLVETQKALALGSLLLSQISEYSAIVLAHKLRRYDCDLEVGLSDEVHPSKSGEINPRGLMKKDSIRQNKIEQFTKNEDDTPIKDIIVSTTATLDGYAVKKYIGVQTSFTVVDEEELERLKFVQKTARMNSELYNYETGESVTSERAFRDYQNSFELLFTDLCDQLKARAMKDKANALLGLSYQLTSLPFEKTAQGGSCYQLTCSATLAVVRPE